MLETLLIFIARIGPVFARPPFIMVVTALVLFLPAMSLALNSLFYPGRQEKPTA